MEIPFTGKRALVTGAGKGIGRSTAKALVQYGAEVIALTRTQADLDSLVKEVPSIKPLCLDATNTEKVTKAIEELGNIDLLVNNAGINILESFLDVKIESYDKIFDINVKAPLFIAQAVAKKMVSNGNGGCIVNVSSQASLIALQDHTVYCTTKAALDMLTKTMALELGPHKIRVNSVNPTVVLTELGRKAWSDPEKSKPMLDMIPLGKFADEEDVVNAILFLLSDKAAMITGALLPVDGGRLVH
ncbi:L-xylulose reductase [Exaiptasia diaphana]|uniref:L-xylulose reductase n=1 Tax=Exaiptasia diaphana TaxID=2652724 RepID=A0A913X836_EXADI|nr:L-xylulose reductase [Exaiptasia diaphana]